RCGGQEPFRKCRHETVECSILLPTIDRSWRASVQGPSSHSLFRGLLPRPQDVPIQEALHLHIRATDHLRVSANVEAQASVLRTCHGADNAPGDRLRQQRRLCRSEDTTQCQLAGSSFISVANLAIGIGCLGKESHDASELRLINHARLKVKFGHTANDSRRSGESLHLVIFRPILIIVKQDSYGTGYAQTYGCKTGRAETAINQDQIWVP